MSKQFWMARLRTTHGWVGVDEAGRGPLAGPVVAAAVLLPPRFRVAGIDDSKKLTREERAAAAERIKEKAHWAIGIAEVEEIDRVNILRASLNAMRRAVLDLSVEFQGLLIDGNQRIPELECQMKCIIDGDESIAAIAAASIIAKTHRDDLMRQLARQYPEYGFEKHFGYSTPEHFRALERYGPCAIHRRSFAPIRQPCLEIGV